MTDSLDRAFGLIIAFLLPGFWLVLAVAMHAGMVRDWLAQDPALPGSLGGFFYVLLSSLAAGMLVSAVRWLAVDTLMHYSGVLPPPLDFAALQAHLEAFELAVHHNYRHYQCYANSAIGLPALAVSAAIGGKFSGPWPWLLLVFVEGVLLITARDCLQRYYQRIGQMIGPAPKA